MIRELASKGAGSKLLRRKRALILLAVAALMIGLYLRGVPVNPPGFFADESSIAYNAYTIAQTGADEHGRSLPLYFEAFGEYKSPTLIYLLAALYKLTGPSIFVARMLSALAGLAAAILMGLLAARMTRSRMAALVVCVTALLTPWLFELSRLVFEVALMPMLLALFLLLLYTVSESEQWSWSQAVGLALVLALINYTYSVGRLLAPLLAFGLLFFATRGRWRGLVLTWLVLLALLLPLFVFALHHPYALSARFKDVSFITPQSTPAQILFRFTSNYLANFNPWSWLVAGDPEPRHHLPGMGSLLVATVLLAAMGIALVLLYHRRDPWWRFVIYGLAVSAVPSSLTIDHFHTLRLVALPIFLLPLAALAVGWLSEGAPGTSARRWVLTTLLFLTILQGALFQWQFHRAAQGRWHNFDTFYTEVFAAATALPHRPIYLLDNHAAPGYIHAYWYATLQGKDINGFVRLPQGARPPAGSLVISTELPCTDCRMILERGSFRAYISF